LRFLSNRPRRDDERCSTPGVAPNFIFYESRFATRSGKAPTDDSLIAEWEVRVEGNDLYQLRGRGWVPLPGGRFRSRGAALDRARRLLAVIH